MFDDLNEENLVMYAVKNYTSPNCLMSEFEGDLKRIKYLKRLLRRYKATRVLKERLILNHIIVLYNIFGESATDMLLFKIDEEHKPALATFLVYLNRLPEEQLGNIALDPLIIEALRKI